MVYLSLQWINHSMISIMYYTMVTMVDLFHFKTFPFRTPQTSIDSSAARFRLRRRCRASPSGKAHGDTSAWPLERRGLLAVWASAKMDGAQFFVDFNG